MSRQVTVTVGDKEKTYSISPLKGKHIKQLLTAEKKAPFEETFMVLEMAGIPEKDIEEMAFKDCLKVQQEINVESFGVEKEEKN